MKVGSLRKTYRDIRRLAPDIVHIHTPFVAHYEGLRLARHLALPVVESYHTYFEEYLENYLRFLPRSFLRCTARRLSASQCAQVDAVVVPSAPMRDVLRAYGIGGDIQVVPTGIPMDAFTGADGHAFRRRYGIPEKRPLLLYVGRLAHEKNLGFLLKVLDRIRASEPDVLMVFAGEGPALNSLQHAAARAGLAKHLLFVGYLSRDRELPDCYAAADVFLFASRTETQGLVLLEAMACGTPVVTTAHMGTAAIMADGRGGLVAAEDIKDFAEKVLVLLLDTTARTALAEDARRKASEWSDSALADRMLELYATVINDRARVARP